MLWSSTACKIAICCCRFTTDCAYTVTLELSTMCRQYWKDASRCRARWRAAHTMCSVLAMACSKRCLHIFYGESAAVTPNSTSPVISIHQVTFLSYRRGQKQAAHNQSLDPCHHTPCNDHTNCSITLSASLCTACRTPDCASCCTVSPQVTSDACLGMLCITAACSWWPSQQTRGVGGCSNRCEYKHR